MDQFAENRSTLIGALNALVVAGGWNHFASRKNCFSCFVELVTVYLPSTTAAAVAVSPKTFGPELRRNSWMREKTRARGQHRIGGKFRPQGSHSSKVSGLGVSSFKKKETL